MKTIKWKNKTTKHPNGVCEGATVTWLKEIKKSGISKANQITAQDCDALQEKCEKDQFSWALDLQSTVNSSAFDAFNGHALKEGGNPKDDMQISVLDHLKNIGDFVYISASMRHGNGHAMALYRSVDKTYYFDPNHGIYEADATDNGDIAMLTQQIEDNCKSWDNVATRYGKI